MSANNQVVLIGRLGAAPAEELRQTQGGNAVVNFNLAVTRPGKDANGNSATDWIACQFWNKQAETLAQYCGKGDLISVSGALRIDTWEQDGQKRSKAFIHGENFQMLESRRAKEERNAGPVQHIPQAVPAPRQEPPGRLDGFGIDDDELPPF